MLPGLESILFLDARKYVMQVLVLLGGQGGIYPALRISEAARARSAPKFRATAETGNGIRRQGGTAHIWVSVGKSTCCLNPVWLRHPSYGWVIEGILLKGVPCHRPVLDVKFSLSSNN